MKYLLTFALGMLLTACGGGDVSDDYVRHAERGCAGPFTGSFSSACQVELRLAGTETITVQIAGRVTAGNAGDTPLVVSRNLHVQLAGAAAGHETLRFELQPGETAAREFSLAVEVPAANLGGYPPVIGLSSYEQADTGSAVVDVTVAASAR